MSDREASFLVCDDLLVSLNGKFFIQGVYTGDIVISGEEQKLNQLIILLQLSTPIQKPFQKLQLSLSLPGEDAPRITNLLPLLPLLFPIAGRRTLSYKVPVPIAGPNLRPGAIEVRITHDEGEVYVGRQWVVSPQQVQAGHAPSGAHSSSRN
jgi:hypothetical protein